MTAATATSVATSSTGRTRPGGRLRDLCWLTWRQHRLLIAVTALGVLGFVGYLLVLLPKTNGLVSTTDTSASGLTDFLADYQLIDLIHDLVAFGVPVLAGVAAVFWGAPLLSREYEQRTNLLVWSQDVSPVRWLMTKVALLGAILVVLTTGLEVVVRLLLDNVTRAAPVDQFDPLGIVSFESSIPLQIGYVLFGFTLGLVASVLFRRTVAAMGVSLTVFGLVRWWLAAYGREHYETPVHYVGPLSPLRPNVPSAGELDFGYLNTHGAKVGYPPACYGTSSVTPTDAQFAACERSHGLAAFYTDYQPLSRVPTFQLIEFGIYLVLTACCLFVVWRAVRRGRQI
ncbi:MAG TPA: hypothetical protein VHX38_12035 [Pseudonocardiaceae bacterium]|jgi:hypothetical protein|nr:hypothetical protein [Pseudonocardiaceae bacterium]